MMRKQRIITALSYALMVSPSSGRPLHGTQLSYYNGGLVQTTIETDADSGGDFLPLNAMLDSRDWVTTSGSNPVNISNENAYGFPSTSSGLSWRTVISVPTQAERAGPYSFVWTGAGSTTWNTGGNVTAISGSGCSNLGGGEVSGVNCNATIDYSATNFTPAIDVISVASGGPTSLQVYNVNDASLVSAGYTCKGTKWASTVGANFGVIRDLNRSSANTSNVAHWSDRTPVSWFSYGASNYFPQSMVTTNSLVNTSGAQYTLAFSGLSLTDKVHVIALPPSITPPSFTSAQTVSSGTTLQLTSTTGIVAGMIAGDANNGNAMQPAAKVASVNSGTNTVTFTSSPFHTGVTSGDTIYFSPMLNVNGTGFIPVVTNTGTAFGSSNTPNVVSPNWSTFTYDAELGVWLTANQSNANSGLSGGSPPEWFTQCANEIGAHPWYVLPAYAMDAPTDYATQLSTYAKANLLPGLVPRFEGPNEDWNYQFFVTIYSDNKEYPRSGFFFDHPNWYGRAISQAGQSISAVYGNDRTKYKVEACMAQNGSALAVVVNSGTYNSTTGAVNLTLASPGLPFFGSGSQLTVRGVGGTGAIANVNGVFTATSGTNSTNINYTIATGLTLTITPGSAAYADAQGNEGEKLASPEYVLAGGSAAYNWVTDMCPTAYYQSSYAGTLSEIGWAYWYSNGASSGQKDTLVGDFLAGAMTTGFAGNLYWLENSYWPMYTAYLATYTGAANITFGMYEGGYGSNAGCGYSYQCQSLIANPTVAVSSVTQGSTTVLTVGANAWNYICNTASLCTGGQPKTTLAFGGGCGLNGLDPAVLSATSTTITVNVNSAGFTGCTTGTAVYDNASGSGGYVTAFELGVKQNMNSSNLMATELSFLQAFYSDGGRFPGEYSSAGTGDWPKYNPDVYQTLTPVISAVQAFQVAP